MLLLPEIIRPFIEDYFQLHLMYIDSIEAGRLPAFLSISDGS